MNGYRLFLRSRRIGSLTALLVVTGLVLIVTPGVLRDSLITAEWASVPLLSASVIPGIIWTMHAGSPGKTLERSLPGHSPMLFRLTLLVGVLAFVVVIASAVEYLHEAMDTSSEAIARNLLFGIGGGSLSAVLIQREVAWLPSLGFAVLNWVAGTSTPWGTARGWALLNADASSPIAAWITLLAVLIGGACYVLFDGRGNR